MKRGFTLILLLFSLLTSLSLAFAKDATPLMHLYEPADVSWVTPVAQPKIPAPPKDKGLIKGRKLRATTPLQFFGNEALAAEAAKPKGFVIGKGTKESPYIIRDLVIRDITNVVGIDIRNVTAPLIIQNVQVIGKPFDERTPAEAAGISLDKGEGTIVRHCEVSNCDGIIGSTMVKALFEDNYVFSTDVGIYTIFGSDNIGRGNYVRDSQRYGVFLYNGPRCIIENNYVTWTQREGIGTNGHGQGAIYRNNVILHSGWTAINVEGTGDDTLVENNLVVDTYYGIILEGCRTKCINNAVFNSSQAGIIYLATTKMDDLVIEGNKVSCTGSVGIDLMLFGTATLTGALVKNNRVEQSNIGIRVVGKDVVVEGNDIFRFFNAVELTKDAVGTRITGNKMYRGRNAVMTTTSERPVITKNTMSYLLEGVHAGASKGGLVEDNNLFEVGVCYTFEASEEWTIRKNVMDRFPYVGFSMTNCNKMTITENVMGSAPYVAISLDGGSGNIITNNEIALVQGLWEGAGIQISNTKDNTFSGNTLKNNGIAVSFKGPANSGNVFKDNKYQNNKKNIVTEGGALDIEKNNTVDQTVTDR